MYTRFTYQKPKGGEHKPAHAVALGYDAEQDAAPRILASGQGAMAEQIIAVAKANGVLVHEDPLLAGLLAGVAIDTLIPPELYALVAEVLAYVYRVQDRR
ncbi:MAG: EscU/YscU/HrcU family type III secretion system export apparatus switch protein [Chloroflexi bacterium]|nr:EscU/YscU/HrcU family type III secretion system export apparatus switch protein [Chloroflexota bacterium]